MDICNGLIIILGVPENYPRRHQLILPAKVQDLQVIESEPDTAYQTRLNTALHESALGSKQLTVPPPPKRLTPPSKHSTPRSQLSYKAISPKADPLPPGLGLQRDAGQGRSGFMTPKNTSPSKTPAKSPGANNYSSRHASRASMFKHITDGQASREPTPQETSNQPEPTTNGRVSNTSRGSKKASPALSVKQSPSPKQKTTPSPKPLDGTPRQSPKINGASAAGSQKSTPRKSQPASPAASHKSGASSKR